MKKTLGIVAALLMCAGIAFADEGDRSIHSIGFSVPVMNQTWYDSETSGGIKTETYSKLNGAGFNFMYHHLTVTPGNFSKFINCELGYTALWPDEVEKVVDGTSSTSSVQSDYAKAYGGFIERYSFGIGGAPVNTDRFILALHGTFGVNGWFGTRNFKVASIEYDQWAFSLWTTIGFNVDAAVRLSDHVGLFAGTNFYTNLIGFSVKGTETKTTTDSSTKTKNDSDGYAVYPGSFNVDFRFGVAFIY